MYVWSKAKKGSVAIINFFRLMRLYKCLSERALFTARVRVIGASSCCYALTRNDDTRIGCIVNIICSFNERGFATQ